MNQEKIGKFIANIRNEKGMTQAELADKIGITDRAISKWENGRGLPDLSLIQPLCKELNISINELLSGEKIKQEEYQEKSEQNIINTFDYSNKKIKRIKSIFIVIITFIIILLVTLFILFNIDMHRMRNNKPVLFSTWGYEYAPPLNLKEIEIYQAIKNYMVEKLDAEISYYEGKKSFVSFRSYLLEEEKKDSTYNVYAWVMYGRYYEENNELKQDAASSAPYKFHVENINDEFKTISSRTPRDGSYYKEDMENIFPKSVREDFNDCEIDGTIDKLTMEIEDQAKLYFHLK